MTDFPITFPDLGPVNERALLTSDMRKAEAHNMLKQGLFVKAGWVEDRAFGLMKRDGGVFSPTYMLDAGNEPTSFWCNCLDRRNGWCCSHVLCLLYTLEGLNK